MSAVDEANAQRMGLFMRNLENRMKEMELTLKRCEAFLDPERVTASEIRAGWLNPIDAPTKVVLINPIDAPVEDC